MTPAVVDFHPAPESAAEWLTPRYECIPALLRQHRRWMKWTKNGEGDKVPCSVATGRAIDPNKAKHWASYEELVVGSPGTELEFAL